MTRRLYVAQGGVRYYIYDDGRVWSTYRNRFMTPEITRGGYCMLCIGTPARKMYVHRLVLEAFRGKPKPGQEGRHMDGNTQNNALTNLRWGSRSRNMRDKRRHGTDNRGERHPKVKLTTSQVNQLRRSYKRDPYYGFIADWSARLNVSRTAVSWAVHNRSWKHI